MEEDALKQQPRKKKEGIKLRHNLRLKAQDIINWCWDAGKLGKMSKYLKAPTVRYKSIPKRWELILKLLAS